MHDIRHATMDDADGVTALLERCAAADGREALSEFKGLRVPVANGVRSLVILDVSDVIRGLVVAAWHPMEIGEDGGYWAAEVALDPPVRSVAAYAAATEALQSDLGDAISLWTFDAVQADAAAQLGLEEVRAIVEMRRGLPTRPTELPAGMTIRPFEVDVDEPMWLALNQKVFANHPEAGSIDSADLALRMAQPWFDAAGLLVLSDGEEPVGYAWTKPHPGDVGEIYMIGLIPDYRGRGLARPLTLAGLEHLAASGSVTAMLYVEASNEAATSLYESMGFKGVRRISLFERPHQRSEC